jgi:hypothetical protein
MGHWPTLLSTTPRLRRVIVIRIPRHVWTPDWRAGWSGGWVVVREQRA